MSEPRYPAELVAETINRLRSRGWGWKTLSEQTGVPATTLRYISSGRIRTVPLEVASILSDTEDEHPYPPGRDALVDSAHVRQMLGTLEDLGWSARWIGVHGFGLEDRLRIQDSISRDRARDIEVIYAHLRGRPVPATCVRCGRLLRIHSKVRVSDCWDSSGVIEFAPLDPNVDSQHEESTEEDT